MKWEPKGYRDPWWAKIFCLALIGIPIAVFIGALVEFLWGI